MNKELKTGVYDILVALCKAGDGGYAEKHIEEIINLCQQDFLKRALLIVDSTFSDYGWRNEVIKSLKAELDKR